MVLDLDVTRRTLSLGAPDATTGWYAKTFTPSTIEMYIAKRGTSLNWGTIGLYSRHDYTGWTDDTIAEGDEILDARSNYYQVNSVSDIPLGDSLYCYECELVKSPMWALRPSTSGTWSSVGDPSYRVRVWLDAALGGYLTAANMKEDDNGTNATTLVAFGMPDYPIQLVFVGTKNVDLIFSVGPSSGIPLIGYDKIAYGNEEKTPVTVCAIDKSGVTARRLVWAGVQEIRRIGIAQSLGTGSLRVVASDKPAMQNLGSTILYSTEVMINWTRDIT